MPKKGRTKVGSGCPGFYENIGRKGGDSTKRRYGSGFFEEIGHIGGKKGGETVKKKYGHGFYERIGHKGGQTVKALISQARHHI